MRTGTMNLLQRIKSMKKHHVILLVATAWVLMSVLILLINPAARKGPLSFGPPAPMKSFQAKNGSYSISYPANWVVGETPQGSHGDDEVVAVILVSGRQSANIAIARRTFPNANTNDVVTWGQARATRNTGYAPVSSEPWSNGKLKGLIHEYTWSSSSSYEIITRYCQDVYVLSNNIGYTLSFCSQEQDWLSLKCYFFEMRDSFSV